MSRVSRTFRSSGSTIQSRFPFPEAIQSFPWPGSYTNFFVVGASSSVPKASTRVAESRSMTPTLSVMIPVTKARFPTGSTATLIPLRMLGNSVSRLTLFTFTSGEKDPELPHPPAPATMQKRAASPVRNVA